MLEMLPFGFISKPDSFAFSIRKVREDIVVASFIDLVFLVKKALGL